MPAFAEVQLEFDPPLGDGFYEIRVLDYLVDPALNPLDGDNFGPFDEPVFPSGDGVSGRDFIGQFAITK